MTDDDRAALRQAALREAVALGGLVAAMILLQHWEQVTMTAKAAWQLAVRGPRRRAPRIPSPDDWLAFRRDIARFDGEQVDDPCPA